MGADIVKEDGDVSLKDVAQIQLGLSRPSGKSHLDLLNAMATRLTDSNHYREFLRKERRKMILIKLFKIVPFRRISQMALLSSHHRIKDELFDYSFSLINKKKIFSLPKKKKKKKKS